MLTKILHPSPYERSGADHHGGPEMVLVPSSEYQHERQYVHLWPTPLSTAVFFRNNSVLISWLCNLLENLCHFSINSFKMLNQLIQQISYSISSNPRELKDRTESEIINNKFLGLCVCLYTTVLPVFSERSFLLSISPDTSVCMNLCEDAHFFFQRQTASS